MPFSGFYDLWQSYKSVPGCLSTCQYTDFSFQGAAIHQTKIFCVAATLLFSKGAGLLYLMTVVLIIPYMFSYKMFILLFGSNKKVRKCGVVPNNIIFI